MRLIKHLKNIAAKIANKKKTRNFMEVQKALPKNTKMSSNVTPVEAGLEYFYITDASGYCICIAAFDDKPDKYSKELKKTREELGNHDVEIKWIWLRDDYYGTNAPTVLLNWILSSNYLNKKIGFCKTPNTPMEAETAVFQCKFDEKIKIPLYTWWFRK